MRCCNDAGSTGGFNPTLVRFCPRSRGSSISKSPMFQSHLGSILPRRSRDVSTGVTWFQSHLGSILPLSPVARSPRSPCFNPTLVRFCRAPASACAGGAYTFQSHLGSILPGALVQVGGVLYWVSIPPWFDFAARFRCARHCVPGSFNPTLVRFCRSRCSSTTGVVHGFNPTLVRFCR